MNFVVTDSTTVHVSQDKPLICFFLPLENYEKLLGVSQNQILNVR